MGGWHNTLMMATMVAEMELTREAVKSETRWVLDSAAGRHATDCKDLTEVVVKVGSVVEGPFGVMKHALSYGKCESVSVVNGKKMSVNVTDAWYVPGLGHRVLSLGRLEEKGCRISFGSGKVKVQLGKRKVDYSIPITRMDFYTIMQGYVGKVGNGAY